MFASKMHSLGLFILITIALLFFTSSCNLPVRPLPSESPTASDVTTATPPGTTQATGVLPESVLTEVAGTLYARITNTAATEIAAQTATSAAMQTSEGLPDAPIKPTLTPTLTPMPTNTATPTYTQRPTLTATNTIAPVLTSAPIITLPGFVPIVPSTASWSTPYYRIRNLNLHDCGSDYAANFKVTSTAPIPLQSLSLEFVDLTTNIVLYGPITNNSPFLFTDRTCNSFGADSLAPYQTLFIGDRLGTRSLQAHTIEAIIMLCTKENLSGVCYEVIIEFVFP